MELILSLNLPIDNKGERGKNKTGWICPCIQIMTCCIHIDVLAASIVNETKDNGVSHFFNYKFFLTRLHLSKMIFIIHTQLRWANKWYILTLQIKQRTGMSTLLQKTHTYFISVWVLTFYSHVEKRDNILMNFIAITFPSMEIHSFLKLRGLYKLI